MESFLEENSAEKKGINKGYVIGALVGVALIAAIIVAIFLQPPGEDLRAKMLEGVFREGSPEFAAVTKDIIISTDMDKTVESPTGMGRVLMAIVGRVRNKGDKTVNILEINCAVIDQQNNVVKEKDILVVPQRIATLGPGENIEVTLALEGFDPKDDRANIRWKVIGLKTQD